MRPLQKFVLVEELKDEKDGLVHPGEQSIKRARVLKIGAEISKEIDPVGYRPGSIVRFFESEKIKVTRLGDSKFLINHEDIIVVEDDYELDHSDSDKAIFLVPTWDEYIGTEEDYMEWKDYENIYSFSFFITFMIHLTPKESLIKVVYESCCRVLRDSDVILSVRLKGSEDGSIWSVEINDDVYACKFNLTDTYFEFEKNTPTTLQNLISIIPTISRMYSLMLASQEFKEVLGRDYNRVTTTSTHINQAITLTKKLVRPKDPVQNWDLMRALLKVENKDDDGNRTLFGLLGAESKSLGRTDITIAFDKDIGDHLYNVSLDVKAPSSYESKLLTVQWIIQDRAPGIITDRDYSPLLTTFFRDIILNSFYQSWFEEVTCTTKFG